MSAVVRPAWVDFHCHLDLYPNHQALIAESDRIGVATLAVTTTPKAWPRNRERAAASKLVRVALGLHPQLAAERADELALFERFLPEARYVGEIGLDAGPRFYRTMPIQERIFDRMLRVCAEQGRKVLSIHSVRSVGKVLKALEDTKLPETGCAVLHWFTGTEAEARRAVELGCYFSINREMLRSEKHRKLVSSLRRDRLLTETDGPFVENGGSPVRPADVATTVTALAALFNTDAEQFREEIVRNLRSVLA